MKESEKNNSVSSLMAYMVDKNPTTVEEWNHARERAKLVYTNGAISALDASGLISDLVKTSKTPTDERN